MRLVLCGITAYEFWRSSQSILPPDFTGFLCANALSSFSDMSCKQISDAIERFEGNTSEPLHVLVADSSDRRHAPMVVTHCLPSGVRLPKGSIYQVSDEISVVSPGLCFLQLAQTFNDLQLVRAGCDLTALFKREFNRNRDLITLNDNLFTKLDLITYLNSFPNCRGLKRAKELAGYVVERTKSPREESMDLLISMPTKRGGYQIPGIQANVIIPLSEGQQALAQREHLECDVVLPNGDLLEYNSSTFHDSEEDLVFDFEKISAMQTVGRTVFPISTRQFSNFEAFDLIMSGVLERQNLRRKQPKPATIESRKKLHASLLKDEVTNRNALSMVDTARWRFIISRS